jgi:glycosyltransferase involved in cell wall biosynthesis
MMSGKGNLLTVVIPTHNLIPHLPRLEKTLKEASENLIKVILVVDQDVDEEISQKIEYLKELNLTQLQILFSETRTPGGARNLGLENVITPWVAFWDSDDEPQVERFSEMVFRATRDQTPEVAVGNFMEVDFENCRSRVFSIDSKSFDFSLANRPGLWRFAFRLSYLGRKRFTNSKLGEDQLFLAELGIRAESIYFSQNIVYKYFTGNPGSLTTHQVAYPDLIYILRELHNLYIEKRIVKYAVLMAAKILLTSKKASIKNRNHTKFRPEHSIRLSQVAFHSRALITLLMNEIVYFRKLSPPIVSIHLAGGLGNQLFQLAAGLKLANSRSILIEPSLAFPRRNAQGRIEISDYILPGMVSVDVERKYSFLAHKFTNFVLKLSGNSAKARIFRHLRLLNCFGRAILSRYLNRKTNVVVSEGLGFSDVLDHTVEAPYLIGLFQSYRWLDDVEVKTFMKSLKLVDENSEFKKLCNLAKEEKPLVVHIRLGDYKSESDFGILSGDYYRGAIERVLEANENIWVFTNEEELANQIFPKEYSHRVRWITDSNLSSSQTLELMRHGASFVIGNSTFSWWAAFLNHSGSDRVVAPSPWFQSATSPQDLIPKNWMEVRAQYIE